MLFLGLMNSGFAQQMMDNLWVPVGGSIYAVRRYGDELFIGGTFNGIGYPSGCYTRINELDASTRKNSFRFPLGEVHTMVSDQQGGVYIGGSFFLGQLSPYKNLVHIRADGSLDSLFKPAPNLLVRSLLLVNGRLFAGGDFSHIGPSSRKWLAELNPLTGEALDWTPEPDGAVHCMSSDGQNLFVGGNFNTIVYTGRNKLAAFKLETMQLNAWNPSSNGKILAMLYHQKKIYIGGSFQNIGGFSRLNIAALHPDSNQVFSWSPDANGNVHCLAAIGDTILAGGAFSSIGGQSLANLAALKPDGTALSAWGPSLNGAVNSMVNAGENIIVGGAFTKVNNAYPGYLLKMSRNGQVTGWDAGMGGAVLALCPNGSLIEVGGVFSISSILNRPNLASIDLTSGDPTSFNPMPNSGVLDIQVNDSTIYVGGSFTTIAGNFQSKLAAFDRSTYQFRPLNIQISSGDVNCIALADTSVYFGGSFSMVNSSSRPFAAAFNSRTGVLSDFNPSLGGIVYTIDVSDKHVFIGGKFSSASGQSRQNLASFNRLTGTITAWSPDISGGFQPRVSSLSCSGSTVYVGGSFANSGNLPRNHLAAFDTSSNTASDWNPNPTSTIYELESGDSVVYLCGAFLYTGGLYGDSRSCIAAVDKISGKARNWVYNASTTVECIDAYTNCEGESVFAGGNFISINGVSRPRLVGMNGIGKSSFQLTTTHPRCIQPAEGALTLQIQGAGTPFSYLLDSRPPQDSGIFVGIGAGEHHLKAIGHDGCIFMDSTIQFTASADTVFPAFSMVEMANQVSFTNQTTGTPISFHWSFGDGDSSSLENPVHIYSQAGEYTACLSIETPCGLKDSCTTLRILPDYSGVSPDKSWNFRLFPNPVSDWLNLEISPAERPMNLEIIDALGRRVWNARVHQELFRLPVNQLTPGVYRIRIDNMHVQAFVVIRE